MFTNKFFRITESTQKQIIPELLGSPESKDIPELIQLLLKAALIRPFSLSCYADFAIEAIREDSDKQELLKCLLDPNTSYPGTIALSYNLLEKDFFSAEQLTDFIFSTYEGFNGFKARYLFVIFSTIIKQRNKDVFADVCHNLYMTYAISGFGNIFASFFRELPQKSDADIKNDVNSPYGEIGGAIVKDDVDLLRSILANPTNNINGKLTPTFYAATDLAQQSPTYIQWSALCGSEKCFTYLLESGADVQINDRQSRSALQYAAAGGNFNILKALQPLVADMDKAKEIAIEYENREVFDKI